VGIVEADGSLFGTVKVKKDERPPVVEFNKVEEVEYDGAVLVVVTVAVLVVVTIVAAAAAVVVVVVAAAAVVFISFISLFAFLSAQHAGWFHKINIF
jgi:uncharacterized Tic20 family protein